MKIRPLHDRILVKRLEEENKTAGGLFIPDTAKEKPMQGKVVAVGAGKLHEDGNAAQARGQGGRQDPVRQVLRHRDQDRRRRAPHPARGRRPRGDRVSHYERQRTGNGDNMAAKEIIFSRRAPATSIASGLNILANAVKVTLGPRGRNVVIEKSWGSPTVTKDGVTVAKEIELEDKLENMGAQMVKEVASKTSDVAGDGTTTATVLAQAIYNEGAKLVAAGHNPMDIKRGIDAAVVKIVDERSRSSPSRPRARTRSPRSAPSAPTATTGDRRDDRRGDGEGRQGGRDHRRGGQDDGDDARRGRGHAVRPRLPVAVLRDRRRAHGGRARGRLHPHPREEDLEHEGPPAAARAGRQERQAAAHHRRGRRRRGAGHPGGQQAARHAAGRARSRRRASAIAARRC